MHVNVAVSLPKHQGGLPYLSCIFSISHKYVPSLITSNQNSYIHSSHGRQFGAGEPVERVEA